MQYGLILTTLMGISFFVQPLHSAEAPEADTADVSALALAPADEQDVAPEALDTAAEVPEEETTEETTADVAATDTLAEEAVAAPDTEEIPTDAPEELAIEEDDAVQEGDVAPAQGADLYVPPAPAPEQKEAAPVSLEEPAAQETAKPEGVEELVPEEGLDTVGLEGGNWLFNRVWWKYAEQKYEKIKQQVNSIMDARMQFFTERNKADRDIFDPFYIHVGFDRGELDEVIFGLIEDLEKERDADEMSDEELALLEKAQEKKIVLEKLKVDVLTITKLDDAINEALDRLMGEINRVRQYEQQAWVTFKKMARLLDDEENKKLYYEIERLSRSIDAIDKYVSGNFTNYFNEQLLAAAQEKVKQVKDKVGELKEKDILDLKKEAMRLDSVDRTAVGRDRDDQEDYDEIEAEDTTAGWLGNIWSTIMVPFVWIWQTAYNGVLSVYDMVLGSAQQEEELELPEMPSVPAEVLEDVNQDLPAETSPTVES